MFYDSFEKQYLLTTPSNTYKASGVKRAKVDNTGRGKPRMCDLLFVERPRPDPPPTPILSA
jgi:hypothetical protein